MAVKNNQKKAPAKKVDRGEGVMSPGKLRKVMRNEDNLNRHILNVQEAKMFGIDPNKKGFRKDVKKHREDARKQYLKDKAVADREFGLIGEGN